MTADTGMLEDRYEYDAFGTPYQGDLSGWMNMGYTGKPYDTATGLYNYGYRDYRPQTARFTTEDPIQDGNNWFAYVNNDPVNWVDPWGLTASERSNFSNNDFGMDFFRDATESFSKGDLLGGLWDTLKGSGDAVVSSFSTAARSTIAGLKTSFSALGNTLSTAARSTIEGLKTSFSALSNTLTSMDLQWFSSNEKPGSNTAQNKQFDYAVKTIEKTIGRDLSFDEIRRLHESISKASPPYTRDEIIDEGIGLYGRK